MKVLDEFEVPVAGLKPGVYQYDYKIGKEFLEFFNNAEIPDGELRLDLIVNKSLQVIELEFHLSGTLDLYCDRCLEILKYRTEINEKMYIRYGEKYEELDDNIIVIPREQSRLNIAQYIYEFTALSIPLKKIHSDLPGGKAGCDQGMIEKLNELVKQENEINNETDPRWDRLKNLN